MSKTHSVLKVGLAVVALSTIGYITCINVHSAGIAKGRRIERNEINRLVDLTDGNFDGVDSIGILENKIIPTIPFGLDDPLPDSGLPEIPGLDFPKDSGRDFKSFYEGYLSGKIQAYEEIIEKMLKQGQQEDKPKPPYVVPYQGPICI